MRDSELDVATILDTVPGLTAGTNLFAGPIPTTPPDQFVCARYTTGEKDGAIGEADGAPIAYRVTVQVIVRGARMKYKETLDLALACFEALTHTTQSSYHYLCPVGGGPSYAGVDENSRHKFAFDVELEYSAELSPGSVVSLAASGSYLTANRAGTDSSGTPGPATINKPSGISAVLSGATSVTVTNSLATAGCRVSLTWLGDHGAARSWVTRAAGSFTVNLSGAASSSAPFGWEISYLV